MKEIVKAFKHIARDILIYILPGLILISFFCYSFITYKNIYDWKLITSYKGIIVAIFVSYILGHIIFSFMELFFVMIPIEEKVKRLFFNIESEKLKKASEKYKDGELEILAFAHKSEYEFFVERHTQLSLFRWNLSGSFFIVSLFSFVMLFTHNLVYLWIALCCLFCFIILFIFSIKTELDGHQRRLFLANKKPR